MKLRNQYKSFYLSKRNNDKINKMIIIIYGSAYDKNKQKYFILSENCKL